MKHRRRPAQALRTAIDCFPLGARRAMLEGVEENRIIVGAYTDRDGGVCPMLAAHRNGGRTSLASFARAWDRYTRASRPRPASDREVRTLRTMLEASIAVEEHAGQGELSEAIADHRGLVGSRPAEKPKARPGDPDRSKELRTRHGWSWLRPFRRLDAYEQALRDLRLAPDPVAQEDEAAREAPLVEQLEV